MITMKDLKVLASNFYLCEPLDESIVDTDEAIAFIVDNVWEPLEDKDPYDIAELIDNDSYTIRLFLEDKGIEVSND